MGFLAIPWAPRQAENSEYRETAYKWSYRGSAESTESENKLVSWPFFRGRRQGRQPLNINDDEHWLTRKWKSIPKTTTKNQTKWLDRNPKMSRDMPCDLWTVPGRLALVLSQQGHNSHSTKRCHSCLGTALPLNAGLCVHQGIICTYTNRWIYIYIYIYIIMWLYSYIMLYAYIIIYIYYNYISSNSNNNDLKWLEYLSMPPGIWFPGPLPRFQQQREVLWVCVVIMFFPQCWMLKSSP